MQPTCCTHEGGRGCSCFMTLTALMRPPLPCATSWLHTHSVPVTHPSRAFYLRNTSWGCGIVKTCGIVLHFDTLLVIRSLSNFFHSVIRPILCGLVEKHFFACHSKTLPIFGQEQVFEGVKKHFSSSMTPMFLKCPHRMGLKTLGKHLIRI